MLKYTPVGWKVNHTEVSNMHIRSLEHGFKVTEQEIRHIMSESDMSFHDPF